MQRIPTISTLAAVLLAALLAACSATPTPSPTSAPSPESTGEAESALTPVRLSLGYIPDVQFTPFYVGIEKGFFADHGIDLTTEHRQETDGARLVATGEIPFAVVSGEQVLLGREQGMPLVYVFEWYQRFPVAIAAKTDSGIKTPEDLAGRSVGTPVKEGASYIGLEALLGTAGLTDEDIDLQTTGYSQVETLVSDRVDAVVIYVANEPVQLEAAGEDITVIEVADYADLVSNGLVTSEEVIADNPELVREMVAGLAESLQYTIDHPDEAFEISQGYVEGLDDPATAETAREVLARSIELWKGDPLGYSKGESWEAMQQILLDTGLLTTQQDIDAAYTNEFLP
jgi:NitT/TauT family transport system substrate-binding protein